MGVKYRDDGGISFLRNVGIYWTTRCHVSEDRYDMTYDMIYEGHLESKERFAIKKYLLIIGKKKNMQILSHTFTYFST